MGLNLRLVVSEGVLAKLVLCVYATCGIMLPMQAAVGSTMGASIGDHIWQLFIPEGCSNGYY